MRIEGFAMVLASLIISCNHSKTGSINNAMALSNKERQYFSNGKGLYQRLCQNCHRDTGEGLGMLIPPLKNSDYLLKDVAGSARVIRYGLKGPIVVNGKGYDQPMPPHSRLTPLEIAEILTYISNSWGNQHGGVTTEAVKKALKSVVSSQWSVVSSQ